MLTWLRCLIQVAAAGLNWRGLRNPPSREQGSFDPLTARDHAEAAARALPLIVNWRSWVHRRVEHIDLMDDARARHHTSIDFTLPSLPDERSDVTHPQLTVIPLMLARKGILRHLSVRDENGRALVVLTRIQNEAIEVLLLTSLAETLLATHKTSKRTAGLSER